MSEFAALLQQAYWRGIPFKVSAEQGRKGRKVAVHAYPYRDGGWVEDLGRAPEVFRFTGYLIGDLAPAMQLALDAACEMPGPGLLIHPTLGAMHVALLSATTSVRRERMRVIEVAFEFIEQGTNLFPFIITNTIGQVLSYASDALPSFATDLIAGAELAATAGAGVIAEGVSVVRAFSSSCAASAADPAALVSMTAGIPPPGTSVTYGRYADGAAVTALPAGTTVASLQSQLAAQRSTVAADAEAAAAAANTFSAETGTAVVTSIAVVVEDARATMSSPVDQVRVMTGLAAFTYTDTAGGAGLSGDVATMRDAMAATCRRVALVSLARAAAAFQPRSYDEAVALRLQLADAFDAEITAAGDSGEDASYLALKNLRASVIQDLTSRGAALPLVETVTFPAPLPALVLGYRLYKNAGRADDVAARARAIHPAFCPLTIQVLAA